MDDMDTGSNAGSVSGDPNQDFVDEGDEVLSPNEAGDAGIAPGANHLLGSPSSPILMQMSPSDYTSGKRNNTESSSSALIPATSSTSSAPMTTLVPTDAWPVSTTKYEPSEKYLKEKSICLDHFHAWNEQDQIHFVEDLLQGMCHYQHGTVNAFLKPMLQRDFITLLPKKGLDHVAETILSYLDARSLCAAELVCVSWLRVISEGMLWKKLIEGKVHTNSLWRGLAERRNWS